VEQITQRGGCVGGCAVNSSSHSGADLPLSAPLHADLIRQLHLIPLVLPHHLAILRLNETQQFCALDCVRLLADGAELSLELRIGGAQRAHQLLQLVQARGGRAHRVAGWGGR